MLLLPASNSLSLLLLLTHLSSFLLIKLFTVLYYKAPSHRDFELQTPHEEQSLEPLTLHECSERGDLVDDVILEREGFLEGDGDDSLLTEQGEDSKEQIFLKVEDTHVSESTYSSPLEDPLEVKHGIEYSEVPVTYVKKPSDCPSPIISSCDNVIFEEKSEVVEVIENKEKEEFLKDSHQDRENFGGSLTGESTSKSSVEWRSSTICGDSETEYPFSSSSRRSSSRWESYTVFRKYDEEMLFFDRVTAQKLTETESLRSIKVHPRSISQRLVHRLTTKTKHGKLSQRGRDPYQELESAYVAQICLTWEALNWNYNNFQRVNADRRSENPGFPAHIAEQFQQFQVLLKRFIENEPYERGRRPEVFARVRISSPKLLRVPEFHEDDEGNEETSSKISASEFLAILEDAIRTFMDFLKADKERPCQKFRSFIKKKANSVDPTFLHLLRKVNNKKKFRLRELGRRKNCLMKWKLEDKKELEILMAMIDMKVVSRVLRMPEISEKQLHWCEQKMSKVRVWDGKIHRDSSTLFFPAH